MARGRGSSSYAESVFINCPFSPDYAPILRAYVFAVMDCGLRPRCARETDNGADIRVEKILQLIQGCRLSIHDLSYTALDPDSDLARFNMPFEFGLAMAADRIQPGRPPRQFVIFEAVSHDTKKCLSDVSGQDCRTHDRSPERIVSEVRDWLRTAHGRSLPGPDLILERHIRFEQDFPDLCRRLGLRPASMVFADMCELIRNWIAENG